MKERFLDDLPDAFHPFLEILRQTGVANEDQARRALAELCNKGSNIGKERFHPAALASRLTALYYATINKPSIRRKMLQYGERRGSFNIRDLRRMASQARRLKENIQKLQRTTFLLSLQYTGQIPPEDLLSIQITTDKDGRLVEKGNLAPLNTIIELPTLARQAKLLDVSITDY